MLFPTVEFAIFFVAVFAANWLTMRRPLVWRLLMLTASYVFYGWWDWRFVPLLAGSAVVNQVIAVGCARAATERRRRTLLAVGVAANLTVLGVFKYYGFFVSSIVNGLDRLGLQVSPPLIRFVLPVGISFFTFQALSYIVDVYRRDARPAPALDFAVYLAFFPQLVAGPIVRPSELLPQIAAPRDPKAIDVGRAFRLIVLGLLKKVVIADYLARTIVDPVFASPGSYSTLDVAAAVYGFSVQIYCDFSAYSDIAIGVALLLGFELPDNFDAPYAARGIRDFWRRWHMTLSRWLRDYLYIPLGGSRGGRLFTTRNLMITMLLGGLWHGASGTFVVWGGLHGAWLVLARMRGGSDRPSESSAAGSAHQGRLRAAAGRLLTFHLVTLAWIVFRADSLEVAWQVLQRLAGAGAAAGSGLDAPAIAGVAVLLAILAGIGSQYVPTSSLDRMEAAFSRLDPMAQGVVFAICLMLIDALGAEGVAAFIYFQF